MGQKLVKNGQNWINEGPKLVKDLVENWWKMREKLGQNGSKIGWKWVKNW